MELTSNIRSIQIEKQSNGNVSISFSVPSSDGYLEHLVFLNEEDLECLVEQVQLAKEVCK